MLARKTYLVRKYQLKSHNLSLSVLKIRADFSIANWLDLEIDYVQIRVYITV